MIKAFLFDMGGVITAGGGGNELSVRFGKNLGITPEEASKLLMPVWNAYSKGKISEPKLWNIIEAAYGKQINKEQRDIWNKWEDMLPHPDMMKLIRMLKVNKYKVGLLSNVIPNTENEIRINGGYDIFDFLVLSCEVGFSKPDLEIYIIALKYLNGIKPEEVVFLDDQDFCLVPARKLGMKTILVSTPAQAIAEVEDLINI